MSEIELDARNILCPLPVIRTQDKINSMAVNDILVVHCTDPGAIVDIPTWCRINGHEVLGIDEQDRDIAIRIKVCES